jgi:hypothetical protein
MKYILVGSPDKMMLSSFIKYLLKTLDSDYTVGELHYLMSEEAKSTYIEDFSIKNPNGIFSYYVRRPIQDKTDPIKLLPEKALTLSDVAVWFDLFATEPILIKDINNIMAPILEQWKTYITRLG